MSNAAGAVARAGWDVVDLQQPLLGQTGRAYKDGVHWSPATTRLLTCTVLSHLASTLHTQPPTRDRPQATPEENSGFTIDWKKTVLSKVQILNSDKEGVDQRFLSTRGKQPISHPSKREGFTEKISPWRSLESRKAIRHKQIKTIIRKTKPYMANVKLNKLNKNDLFSTLKKSDEVYDKLPDQEMNIKMKKSECPVTFGRF